MAVATPLRLRERKELKSPPGNCLPSLAIQLGSKESEELRVLLGEDGERRENVSKIVLGKPVCFGQGHQ